MLPHLYLLSSKQRNLSKLLLLLLGLYHSWASTKLSYETDEKMNFLSFLSKFKKVKVHN